MVRWVHRAISFGFFKTFDKMSITLFLKKCYNRIEINVQIAKSKSLILISIIIYHVSDNIPEFAILYF